MAISTQIKHNSARMSLIEGQLRPNGIVNDALLNAFAAIPREDFCPDGHEAMAYSDEHFVFDDTHAMFPPLLTAKLIQACLLAHTSLRKVAVVSGSKGYTASLLLYLGAKVTAFDEQTYLDKMADIFMETSALSFSKSANIAALVTLKDQYDLIFIEHSMAHIPHTLMNRLKPLGMIATILQDAHSPLGRAVVLQKNGKKLEEIASYDAWCPLEPLCKKEERFSIDG